MPRKQKIDLDEKTAKKLVKHLRDGNYIGTSASLEALEASTVHNWLRRGRRAAERQNTGIAVKDTEIIYASFYRDAVIAMSAAENKQVLRLTKASKKDWRAAVEYLERKFPDRWGRRINVNVDNELNKFLDTLEANLDKETFNRVLRAANEADSRTPNREGTEV